MMVIIFKYLFTFALGLTFGFYLLPLIVEEIKECLLFTSNKAAYIAKNAEKVEKQSIIKSRVFKDRLEEILKTIKERASEEHTSVRITFIDSCKTDKQIRIALKKRGFQSERESDNSLLIYW